MLVSFQNQRILGNDIKKLHSKYSPEKNWNSK